MYLCTQILCEMIRIYLIKAFLLLFLSQTAVAQKHTEFVGVSLDMSPDSLAGLLADKGLQREKAYEFSGRIAGLDTRIRIGASKDTADCNYLMLSTQAQQGNSLHDDYKALMQWMQKHYGRPVWEGRVRSHPFARWLVGFDRDIVMISTASSGVEIWFYENHQVRHIDYYSVLKYCERHPSPYVPFYTAEEQVTWQSTAPPVVTTTKKVTKRQKVRRKTRHTARRSKRHRR